MTSKGLKPLNIVPIEWMPCVEMRRIINHWTAGHYEPTAGDLEHYHIVITGQGELRRGKFSIEANVRPKGLNYAAHTLNCNGGSIGVSLACMVGAIESPFNPGPEPMREIQWHRMVEVNAALALFYNIPVTPQTILSHAEVQANLGIRQRQKWDFTRLPFAPDIKGARLIGDKLRAEVAAQMKTMSK